MRKFNRLKKKRNKELNKKTILFVFFGIIFLAFILLIFLIFKTQTLDRFVYINNKDGNAEVLVIDPQKDTSTKMLIDKELLLKLSKNMGEYTLSSVWILDEKGKFNGRLVTETVVKNFGIPVYLWKNREKSNLNVYQKIKIKVMGVEGDDYKFFIKSKKLNNSMLINFVYPEIMDGANKIQVDNLSGNENLSEDVSRLLETIGFKTVGYSKGYDELLDCEIIGKNKKQIELISQIFDCENVYKQDLSIDLIIRIGKLFADRF